MSQSRPPSPLHPPPFATTTVASMTSVQSIPNFPPPSFLGRSEHRSQHGPQLPPLQTAPLARAEFRGPTLPPIQLSPMQSDPAALAHSTSAGGRVAVANLLSSDPPSPRRACGRALPREPTYSLISTPAHLSLARGYSVPGSQLPPYQSTHIPDPGRRVEQPPVGTRHPPLFHHIEPQPRLPFNHPHYPFTRSEPPDEPQYSPVPIAYSSAPSFYDYSSEASPRSAAPTADVQQIPPFRISQPPSLNYHLSVRQQPAAARACGFGERDRRVIDPPPILELKITDRATGAPAEDSAAMLALHCTLLKPDNDSDETEVVPTHPEMLATRRLMGTLVASPYQAKDERGNAGTFFVLSDLSCRSPGKYRLHFKLLRIDPMNMTPGAVHGSVAQIVTVVFTVYTAKDFPGMQASSALLKSLRRQGLNVGVKKGSQARKGKGKTRKEGSSSDEDEDEDESEGYEDDRRGSANTADGEMTEDVSPRPNGSKKTAKRKQPET